MSQPLEYAAAATDRVPWGPILVRPSRRSVLLFLVTAAVAVWVAARHTPWIETAFVSGPRGGASSVSGAPMNASFGDGVFMVADESPGEVVVFDANTGDRIRTFGQETGPDRVAIPGSGTLLSAIGYYLVPRTGMVFARSPRRDTVRLLDPRTGDARATAVGRTPPGRIFDVAAHATGVTVLYAEQRPAARGEPARATFGLWRPFDDAARNPVRTFDLPAGATGRISPDGATVLFWSPVKPDPPDALAGIQRQNWQMSVESGGWATQLAQLYDATTGGLLVELPHRDSRTTPTFSANGRVLVSLFDPGYQSRYAVLAAGAAWARTITPTPPPGMAAAAGAPAIDRHDAHTGRLLSSASSPAGLINVSPFGDGASGLLEITSNTRGVFFTRVAYAVDLTRPGVRVLYPPGTLFPSATPQTPRLTAAFPDGRRMLVGGGMGGGALVVDNDRQPLAHLAVQGAVGDALVSSDGDRVALRTGGIVRLFRRAGFECRESHLGVLGMPHIWLLGACLAALAFSLRGDARRAPSAATLTPAAATVAVVMLIVALPRTFHALLAGLTGEIVLTPAPLLLIAAIGLATGSRFWRLLSIVVLAGVASVWIYCLLALHRMGLAAWIRLDLIDRTFDLARLVARPIFVLGVILAVAATFAVVRAPRSAR